MRSDPDKPNIEFTHEVGGKELDVKAFLSPPDPSVGIMWPQVEWLVAYDEDGNEVIVTDELQDILENFACERYYEPPDYD